MNRSKYYKFKQLEAIDHRLNGSEEYFYRKMCRWFSKEYSTPLLQVFDIPYDILLTHYYESSVDNMSFNDTFDLAQKEYIQEYIEKFEKEDQEFADSLVEEQKETLRKKAEKEAKKQQSLVNKSSEKAVKDTLSQPKSFSLNFEDEEI